MAIIRIAGITCLVVSLAGARADAQYVATYLIGVRSAAVPITVRSTHSALPAPEGNPLPRVAVRTASGAVGWVVGGIAGGFVGYRVLPHQACGCDDPGLNEFLVGAVAFGAIGAALGAAIPLLESTCSFGTRVGRSLLGSAVGTGVGFLARSESGRLVAIPVLSISGASLAEWRC